MKYVHCLSQPVRSDSTTDKLIPMANRPDPEQQNEHTLLLALFAIFLFGSPLTLWWASDYNPWYLPYLLWLLVILIGALLSRHYRRHDL